VSSGQINVPSGDNLRAAYPPFPLVIAFLILCKTFGNNESPYFVDVIK
jgi:hypothetical protein